MGERPLLGLERPAHETEAIPAVPVDYAPLHLTITGPEAVYPEGGRAVVPVRWTAQGRPVCQPDQVRNCNLTSTSSATRCECHMRRGAGIIFSRL